jgi:glucose-6-phosphate isomerase
MKESIKYYYTNLLSDAIGNNGVPLKEIYSYEKIAAQYKKEIKSEYATGNLKFIDLPFEKKYSKDCYEYAKKRINRYDNFVVLGIGGSALGNIALLTALQHPYYNLLSKKERKGLPRIFILDNIDPDQIGSFLDVIDVKKTLFNVISKSGETAETMSQFLIFYDQLKKQTHNYKNHLVITTDANKGFLRKIIEKEKIDSFIVPDGIGGRFSVLTPVGLLSSAFANINLNELLRGAKSIVDIFFKNTFKANPIILNSLFHYHYFKNLGKDISVMMSYSYRLKDLTDWYRQLWAESLGKRYDLTGKEIFTGQTPIKALGVTDQHSQVQLYTEGPNNKIFTILQVQKWDKTVKIPKVFKDIEGLSYLGGSSLNNLMMYERIGTEYALALASRPTCKIIFPKVNEFTVGQFIMFYELQTLFTGKLLNINPFDQPGVEAGKKATYALMRRKGYENVLDDIKSILTKTKDYLI